MTIKFSDITGGGIPYGNNAGRPANPGIGKLYSNGEEKRLELYTSTGWQNIVSETPGVVSVSGNYNESIGSATLEITGTNFSTGAIASAIGTNGVEVNASSTTVNSIVSITTTFSGLSAAYEPYDIKVTNTSNLFGLLPDALYINQSPIWQTSSGSLGTFNEQVSINLSALSATDPESTPVTYALANGSALPSGVSLNGSTGVISGTLPAITTDTVYTFTINASDGVNVIPRSFSITSIAAFEVAALVIGGGGGGGNDVGGGGGAGGVLYKAAHEISRGTAITVTVGNGGTGADPGNNGQGSQFDVLVANGGGGGGYYYGGVGIDGGSGGGAAGRDNGSYSNGGAATQTSNNGGIGYGNSGGGASGGNNYVGAGGGGAGAVGESTANDGSGGAGGAGLSTWSVWGLATDSGHDVSGVRWFAGGGSGGSNQGQSSVPGSNGGGGRGAVRSSGTNTAYASGIANTGGGGGGSGAGGAAPGNGGSGIVIIRYPDTLADAVSVTNGVKYVSGGYKYYKFNTSGTITF